MASAAIFSSLWRIEIFIVLFEFLSDSNWGSRRRSYDNSSSLTVLLCLNELYLLLYHSKILVDYSAQSDELWSLLENLRFRNGDIPNQIDLRSFFIEKLMINDMKSCRNEIEFSEEQIVNHDGDLEPTRSVINGFVAITRYYRFLILGFIDDKK
ncbi:U-box domain-containing protein 17 [Cardamine amara subsp. amara]|uniref:U-box domain-containing protein 17 n=1 Tax=Cardamine amara subsp. amara TaxID=228776 RepID=A0ABD0Z691_CARAN